MADSNQTIESKPAKPQVAPAGKPKTDKLPPYLVILLDDNDHSYEYVAEMLQNLFGHSPERSFLLAEQVDRTGRAIVCTTHKERAELKRDQILGYGCDFRVSSSKGSMKAVIEPAPQ